MTTWDRRIQRALELQETYPAAAELLAFYCEIARFLKGPNRTPGMLLTIMRDAGPPVLATAAERLMEIDEWDPADPTVQFVNRVLHVGQAFSPAQSSESPTHCPACSELPVVASLKPEGEGGKRYLTCSLCFIEWPFNRMQCPHCGEHRQEALPVYNAEQFPYIRIEACDTCKRYIKCVDMTRNGLAIPEVDEMASLPLDIWATGQNYIKIQTNLFGL